MCDAQVFRVKLSGYFLQIDITAKSCDSLIGLINFDSRFYYLRLQLILFTLCWHSSIYLRSRVVVRHFILLKMHFFQYGKHQIINWRKLARQLRIHSSNNGKLIRLLVKWQSNTTAINNHALSLTLVRTQLIEDRHTIRCNLRTRKVIWLRVNAGLARGSANCSREWCILWLWSTKIGDIWWWH
jgi:hypothetical protein